MNSIESREALAEPSSVDILRQMFDEVTGYPDVALTPEMVLFGLKIVDGRVKTAYQQIGAVARGGDLQGERDDLAMQVAYLQRQEQAEAELAV